MARGSAARKLRVVAHDDSAVADLGEVEEFAAGLTDKYLFCRELGHNWKAWAAKHRQDGTFDRTLRCNRCTARRIQVISRRGVVLSSHYEHPEGYLNSGHGRIVGDGRGILRLESIKRTIGEA